MIDFFESLFDQYIENYQKSDIALWIRNNVVRKMNPRHWKWFIIFYVIFTATLVFQISHPILFQILNPETHSVSWITYNYEQNFEKCHKPGASINSCIEAHMEMVNTTDDRSLPCAVGFTDSNVNQLLQDSSITATEFSVGELKVAAESYYWCISDIVCENQERLLVLYSHLKKYCGFTSNRTITSFIRTDEQNNPLYYLGPK